MNKLRDDCFETGGKRMPIGEALELLKARLGPVVGKERIALKEAAGRVLAETITSPC